MTKYEMDDGVVADTLKSRQSWDEATRWDGRNMISVPTGSQWEHEEMYLSMKGRYYLVSWSQRQGSCAAARWVDKTEAAAWLSLNGHEIPADLAEAAESITE